MVAHLVYCTFGKSGNSKNKKGALPNIYSKYPRGWLALRLRVRIVVATTPLADVSRAFECQARLSGAKELQTIFGDSRCAAYGDSKLVSVVIAPILNDGY
jgi:hypothetical protein